jgi:hypothetical protein
MAARALVQELGQACGDGLRPASLPQICRDRGCGQIVERQLGILRVLPELGDDGAQRMRVHNHVDGPVRAQDQEACRVAPAYHVRQPLQGGAITPVQIFQDEHQGACGGEHLERLGELPQHAGGCDAADGVLKVLPVLGGEQGREVHEPAQRILPQHGEERGACGFPAEASQRLQHGEIGFPRPIEVQALAVADPDVLCGTHLGDKGLHQRCLADAGLPHDHSHLALPLPRRGPPLLEPVQFGVTPNDGRRAAHRGGQ